MPKMAKKTEEYIDLKERRSTDDMPMVAETKHDEPHGPTLYIHDITLPLSDDDLESVIKAEIKFKPRRISKTIENGKTRCTYDLEVLAIKIEG